MFIATADAQKQAGGEKNLQVLFAPLGGSPITLNGGGISFRKFNSTGDAAWRLNFFFGMTSKEAVSSQPIDTGTFATGGGRPIGNIESKSLTIGLRPGYEKHFAGTEALSPYIGVELLFSMTSASTDSDFVVSNGTVTPFVAPSSWVVLTGTTKGKGASTTLGINLIAGVDYYIAKSLSLGAEFGFGYSRTSNPDIERSTIGNNATTGAFEIQTLAKEKQGSSSNIGPNVTGQLKLGWLFN
jgi:hypothetical protein